MEEHNHAEHHRPSHAWKWAIAILVVVIAFVAGVALGKLSVLFGGYGYGYGYPMMGGMGPWMMYGGYGYPGGYAYPQTPAVPANGTTTSGYYYPMYRMMGGYYYPQATSTP